MLLAAALTVAGCGDDGTGDAPTPEAQPAPPVSRFTEGALDEVPLPPRSDLVGPRSEMEGVAARTYEVTGTTVEEVMEFYRDVLGGLQTSGPVEDVGDGLRGKWITQDGRTLQVSAVPAPTLGDDERDPVVQLSLQLGPAIPGTTAG